MISKRVPPFIRQITVCLTLILISFLFVLSCQKDESLKQKDPNALTKSQAKEYFEHNAKTIKFFTSTSGPAETKNQDYSLTENMVIEWDQALEGDNLYYFFVEVPIRMTTQIKALLYDGVGHINKNIRQVPMVTSLLFEKNKKNGLVHHYLVTSIGTYKEYPYDINYSFLCNKSSYSGYQIFSSENGEIVKTLSFHNGKSCVRTLYCDSLISKVDACGQDLSFRGIAFVFSSGISTKGGGDASSGEDNRCPECGAPLTITFYNDYIYAQCQNCPYEMSLYFDPLGYDACPDCHFPIALCQCVCTICGYPNKYGKNCMCETGTSCPYCGTPGCNGNCGGGADSLTQQNQTYSIIVHANNQGGYISKSVDRNYYFYNEYLSLTAHPYSGYYFSGWYEDNILVSSLIQYSFCVCDNRELVAHFDIDN
ncbi:MAG: hypothetical protein IJK39_08610 [Bacteroidales bacterium]|jgi:hypothetical protein|nr:hypothetical protein [Bacteroidales bacterium]MBR6972101.1 hypothetical protein [Bacteroidales bacterium]